MFIKINHLYLLSISVLHTFPTLACTEELMSTPKIVAFRPNPLTNENFPFLSNPVPYPEYL